MPFPARRIAAISLLIITIACGKRTGALDDAAIERDLEERTVQELYDEVDAKRFDPPLHARLNEQQIATYVRVATLAKRIETIANRRLEAQADSASRDEDRFSRMATAFAAVGTMRAVVTAELRASLMLEANPQEQQWVGRQIAAASRILQQKDEFDARIDSARDELRRETDTYLHAQKRAAYDRAIRDRKTWEARLSDIELANVTLVARHRDEL